MTSVNPAAHGSVMPYQRYLDATHAARDAYLAATYHAHRMYLTGPWPDRETYQQVENTAWKVYYAAAREAWQRYTAEVMPPEPLPARTPGQHLTRDAAGEVWPADPPRTPPPAADFSAARPWPTGYEVPRPASPTYTPNPEGDQ